MSGEKDNLDRSYSDRISELGDRLHDNAGDETILGEVHVAIRNMLLESGDSETGIRAELQKRFDEGQIRPESFELVQEMLGRIALEKTTKLDSPLPMDVSLGQPDESDAPAAVDFPLMQTQKLDVSVPLDLPLEQTTKFTSPTADRPAGAPATTEVALDQTVRISSPFLEQQPPQQDLPPRDASPTDEVMVIPIDDDDQDFVNTAVLVDPSALPRSADDQLQVGSVLRDRFLLQEQLSGGSMGVVFKALDRRLAEAGEDNAYVAIKVLSSELSGNANALRALQQEAAKGRFLSHPNIVRFIDIDREDSLNFIVMEWLDGRSLAQLLDESAGKKLELSMALNVVSQIARALDYAHLRGVVHADVKPGNIIITPDGHAKLLDFGIARIRQKQLEGKSKFDPAILGAASPAYSSMQVLTGEDPAPTDDVFSLGCLLYRMLAGIRVFGPRNAADAAAEGMEPQRPQDLSDDQWRALKKSLSYSRVTRFATPKAFVDAFIAGSASSKPAAKPVPQPAPQPAPQLASQPAPQPVATPVASPKPAAKSQPGVSTPAPVITARRDPSPYDADFEGDYDKPRRSPWRLAVIGTILLASVAVVTQTNLVDYVDELAESDTVRSLFGTESSDSAVTGESEAEDAGVAGDDGIIDAPADAESILPDVVETNVGVADEFVIGEDVLVEDDELFPDESIEAQVEPVVELPEFDYSGFAEATISVSLAVDDGQSITAELSVREGAGPAILELTRGGDLSAEFSLSLSETEYSSSTSPLESGRYELGNNGVVNFAIGQARAQATIAIVSNSQREADVQVTLQARGFADTDSTQAEINLTLEDDDRRDFESGLEPNTVSFAVGEVTVRESDPAVQVDLIRYRADAGPFDVDYVLTGISATEGEDYFTPGFTTVSFGPGETTARILLPLGQDAKTEADETFTFELLTSTPRSQTEILTRLTVVIRDDD